MASTIREKHMKRGRFPTLLEINQEPQRRPSLEDGIPRKVPSWGSSREVLVYPPDLCLKLSDISYCGFLRLQGCHFSMGHTMDDLEALSHPW